METKTIHINSNSKQEAIGFIIAKVLKYLIKDLKQNAIQYWVIDREIGINANVIQSATILIKAKNLDWVSNHWIGTILWIEYDANKPTQNTKKWFINIRDLAKYKLNDISEKSIDYHSTRSQGAGGQHVNKVNTAIRATHKETGVTVIAMDSRSQSQNKKMATERLIEKVYQTQFEDLKRNIINDKSKSEFVKWGKPIKVFKSKKVKKKKKIKTYKSKRNQLKNDLRKEL